MSGSGCLAVVVVAGHREAERMADLLREVCHEARLSLRVATVHYGIKVPGHRGKGRKGMADLLLIEFSSPREYNY